jgi:lauroyl/myristoyl acyltransferase
VYSDPGLDKAEDCRRITQRVMDIFDAAIRAQPEQYFWYNKRWVLDPLRKPEPGEGHINSG